LNANGKSNITWSLVIAKIDSEIDVFKKCKSHMHSRVMFCGMWSDCGRVVCPASHREVLGLKLGARMDSEEKVCMDFEQQILEPYSQSLCTPI
jgi:hypothetical protein